MTVKVDIDPARFARVPRQLLPYALDVAGRARVAKLQRTLATPYPPASSPGRPPHRRTGTLQASVGYEVVTRPDAVVLRIGATAPYAKFLEFGTRKMAPRPFLLPLLSAEMRDVATGIVGWMRDALAAAGWGVRS